MTKLVTSHVKKKTIDLLGELGFVVSSIVEPKVAPLPKDEDRSNSKILCFPPNIANRCDIY